MSIDPDTVELVEKAAAHILETLRDLDAHRHRYAITKIVAEAVFSRISDPLNVAPHAVATWIASVVDRLAAKP